MDRELEFQKFELEKKKLRLEERKFAAELRKIHLTLWSIGLPILLASISIIVGVIGQRQQAATLFELKAAEVVMSASDPDEAAGRAVAIKDLFGNRLPVDFVTRFRAEQYGS